MKGLKGAIQNVLIQQSTTKTLNKKCTCTFSEVGKISLVPDLEVIYFSIHTELLTHDSLMVLTDVWRH